MLRLYFYIILFNAITVNWSLIISLSFVNRQLSIDVRVIEPFLLSVQPLDKLGVVRIYRLNSRHFMPGNYRLNPSTRRGFL